jgi:hypothetical protein
VSEIAIQMNNLRRRFADMSTEALVELWKEDGRTDWAEQVLREELLSRGVDDGDLDAGLVQRERLAADPLPKMRDSIWKYAIVGRLFAYGGAIVAAIAGISIGPVICVLAAASVLGFYCYILVQRYELQRKQSGNAAVWVLLCGGEAFAVLMVLLVFGLPWAIGAH